MTQDEENAKQKQHALELQLAREQQRQMGGTLSEARQVVNQKALDDERKDTEHKTLLDEVDRRIEARASKLTITGPSVSGDAKSGWAVNADAGSGDDSVTQPGQMFISGQIYDVVFLLASAPVAV